MTKPCTHCGGWGVEYSSDLAANGGRRPCDACNGTGTTDDAEHEPETCHICDGEGCRRCKGTGEVWRKVDTEPSEVAE